MDNVLMVLYGDDAKSDELLLAHGELCQDQLTSDQFEVKTLYTSVD